MGLKLIKDGGVVRRAWYGQYKEGGRYRAIRLTTPMRGERIPSSLAERGDEAFERSREAAQAEFDRFEAERGIKGGAEHLTEALIESKTGQSVEYVTLAELEATWRRLHPRERSEGHDRAVGWFFRLFTDAVRRHFVYEVTVHDVSTFYEDIRQRFAWSTVRRVMHLLRGAFDDALPAGATNPFTRVELVGGKDAEAVHRRPLSDSELRRLFAEAERDPLLHSLAVTTACTGMRIGDVCNLKWSSVDLAGGLINVVTRKTGAEVAVPILAPLRAVLEGALAEVEDNEEYVFPDAAQMYRGNYTGLIWMGKVLFARALFADEAEREAAVIDADATPKSPAEVLEVIRSARWSAAKREKVERTYSLYASGSTYREIERETGFSRGQISMYLHEVEEKSGANIVKWAKRCATSDEALVRKTRQERKVGRHSASLYGWHSLRASFVVAALTAGVPLEVVRRVVGHTTADMTLEYFNPTKRIMAETVRRRLAGSVIGGSDAAVAKRVTPGRPTERPAVTHPIAPLLGADTSAVRGGGLAAMVAGLSPEEREQLKALLG